MTHSKKTSSIKEGKTIGKKQAHTHIHRGKRISSQPRAWRRRSTFPSSDAMRSFARSWGNLTICSSSISSSSFSSSSSSYTHPWCMYMCVSVYYNAFTSIARTIRRKNGQWNKRMQQNVTKASISICYIVCTNHHLLNRQTKICVRNWQFLDLNPRPLAETLITYNSWRKKERKTY